MKELEDEIIEKYELDADATHIFTTYLQQKNINKFENIVEKGEFNDNFYILKKGIMRAYIPDEVGEQTLWFGYPGQAIFDIWCYYYGSPSPISIEAVIPCELYYISKNELEDLCNKSLSISNLIRKIFIGHAAETEESNTSLYECDGGLERYISILERHPELLQNVPLKKLASYIHLTPQSLSRIRGKVK